MSKIQIALESANEQIEQGWIDVDDDKYETVQARLDFIDGLIRAAERELARMEK